MNSVAPPELIDELLTPRPSDASEDTLGERILDAAFEQFRLLGIRRSSMEDIARRAGVGRVTIYRRFESKERLVQSLLLRECQRGIAFVEASTAHVTGIEEGVVETFLAAMSVIRKHPLVLGLLEKEPETILPLLTVKASLGVTIGRAYVAQKVRTARRAMGLPEDDAEQIGEVYARLALSLVLTPKTCLPVDDDEPAREFARRYIVPMVTRKIAP